ncbi:MAG: hypothetical protein ABI481_02935 [Pyrinomonadaceae bacterium]
MLVAKIGSTISKLRSSDTSFGPTELVPVKKTYNYQHVAPIGA